VQTASPPFARSLLSGLSVRLAHTKGGDANCTVSHCLRSRSTDLPAGAGSKVRESLEQKTEKDQPEGLVLSCFPVCCCTDSQLAFSWEINPSMRSAKSGSARSAFA
jgi:hypothetical protein